METLENPDYANMSVAEVEEALQGYLEELSLSASPENVA